MAESSPFGSTEPSVVSSLSQATNLLSAADDTSRFVGLALLHSILDNSPAVRDDPESITELWDAIPASFLDRLLRAGARRGDKPASSQAQEMASLAVGVLHVFASLLPTEALQKRKVTSRVPALVRAVLYCADEQTPAGVASPEAIPTAQRIFQTLSLIVASAPGAASLVAVDDISSLTEAAPAHPAALQVLSVAWLTALNNLHSGTSDAGLREQLILQIDVAMQSLVAAFSGTDGATLLGFVAEVVPRVDAEMLPQSPRWLPRLVTFIQKLVLSRPSAESRSAYTLSAAALIHAFPSLVPGLLFVPSASVSESSKPFVFLFINLLLIDIRSSCPSLLSQLNSPTYANTSARLAGAYDVCSTFIGHLLRLVDPDPHVNASLPAETLPIDLLLKLRHSFTETLTLTIEYLRDRWDASVAGAMGLDPSARSNAAEGVFRTLAWDSASDNAAADPFILAALRTLAIWLAEDDAPALVRSAVGLSDMLIELYSASHDPAAVQLGVDFRDSVLIAFEPLMALHEGREAFVQHGGWAVLAADLIDILEASSGRHGGGNISAAESRRATGCVRVLLALVEASQTDSSSVCDEWLDVVTRVAAWHVPDQPQAEDTQEAQVAALQLATALMVAASKIQRARYIHSIAAIAEVETRLREKVERDGPFWEALEDVRTTVKGLQQE
ncbi:putative protein C16C4.02c [Ceratocystis platani]|uniref:Neurochondrin n=1 Tax=Ceratocystis fimbriata f. sp. platani TaxID=88771 RepID=A0A0F8D293_CERFI|nr:putative protein C16C4.02c [Ceratocystis platani]